MTTRYSLLTQQRCLTLKQSLLLPETFVDVIQDIYFPLSELILEKKQNKPILVSINGAQGTGKSTLTAFVKLILESEINIRVAALSLDDFYKTRTERNQLAQDIHPLLKTRSVPGTHDLSMMENTISAMLNKQSCTVPIFNKAIDDRLDQKDWVSYDKDIDIILFEGWCNNSQAQASNELINPINDLEEKEDPQGVWRHYANENLDKYYHQLFKHADIQIMLEAPDFDHVYQWRKVQEQKLKSRNDVQSKIMNDDELNRFIQHFERITRHALDCLPSATDVLIPIDENHSVQTIIRNNNSI